MHCLSCACRCLHSLHCQCVAGRVLSLTFYRMLVYGLHSMCASGRGVDTFNRSQARCCCPAGCTTLACEAAPRWSRRCWAAPRTCSTSTARTPCPPPITRRWERLLHVLPLHLGPNTSSVDKDVLDCSRGEHRNGQEFRAYISSARRVEPTERIIHGRQGILGAARLRSLTSHLDCCHWQIDQSCWVLHDCTVRAQWRRAGGHEHTGDGA